MAKLFQVSTYDALKRGNYDYTISIDYFLRNGDIGLGAYNGLNGEAIFLDGKAYNASSRGFVREMTIPQTGISFGQITKFNPQVDEICSRTGQNRPILTIEPGRSIVANSGI